MTKEFKPKFVKGYCNNLLDWKGLEKIINTMEENKHPTKSIANILFGENFVDNGIAIKRPIARPPQ